MRKTYLLLGSVSAVAMAAAVTGAQAQDAGPGGYTLSVEGGGLFAEGLGADKLGEMGTPPPDVEVDLEDNVGYRAAISLGTRIDNFWDVRAGAAINRQIDATSTIVDLGATGGPGYYSITNGFDHETLDFEVGYTPELDGAFNVRLFGGVRGMHYADRQVWAAGADKVGMSVDYQDEFVGAGPRIGVEGSTRLGDSIFGLSGSISAAAMYGVSTESYDVEVTGTGGPPPGSGFATTDNNKWVYNLEASVGVDAYLSDDATLTVGYHASTTSPVGEHAYLMYGDAETKRFSHGPTLKLTIQAD